MTINNLLDDKFTTSKILGNFKPSACNRDYLVLFDKDDKKISLYNLSLKKIVWQTDVNNDEPQSIKVSKNGIVILYGKRNENSFIKLLFNGINIFDIDSVNLLNRSIKLLANRLFAMSWEKPMNFLEWNDAGVIIRNISSELTHAYRYIKNENYYIAISEKESKIFIFDLRTNTSCTYDINLMFQSETKIEITSEYLHGNRLLCSIDINKDNWIYIINIETKNVEVFLKTNKSAKHIIANDNYIAFYSISTESEEKYGYLLYCYDIQNKKFIPQNSILPITTKRVRLSINNNNTLIVGYCFVEMIGKSVINLSDGEIISNSTGIGFGQGSLSSAYNLFYKKNRFVSVTSAACYIEDYNKDVSQEKYRLLQKIPDILRIQNPENL